MKAEDDEVRIPLRPREWLHVLLHKRALGLVNAGYRLRSVTLTSSAVYLAFSRSVNKVEPRG